MKKNNLPIIRGAGGGGGGNIAKNSLFSTDILVSTIALGEGPVYRINPNGPQDIQINEGSIDSLLNLDGDGSINLDEFVVRSTSGTITQGPLQFFGDKVVTPQSFSSPVNLKKGNLEGIPRSEVASQSTSANDWDALIFNFVIDGLYYTSDNGNVKAASLSVVITIRDNLNLNIIEKVQHDIVEKTDSPFKFSVKIDIPEESRNSAGYVFTVEKGDIEQEKEVDEVKFIGWDEVKYVPQAYPRTAVIGYALKSIDQYTGSVPTFTSMLKGMLVKVPSNYNQPVLTDGQIDWREIEVSHDYEDTADNLSYRKRGYSLQNSGPEVKLFDENIPIYLGTWDGSFVYSWTQNPVWIVYDILTNRTYGLGIPEENIDKYRFYQIAQYCDACDPSTGYFTGVAGVADGTFRYKPRETYTNVRENQLGLPKGAPIRERRFISDISIVDQEKSVDLLNKIASTFRSILVYSSGKITLATDLPDEYPVMLFTDANMQKGSLQFSGTKESDIYTAVDVTYIEPSNHFKRESVRIDIAEANTGELTTNIDNTLSLDLFGVTRRSQAIRAAQYQLASSRYQRRSITFIAGTDAFVLSPGDIISVATNASGVSYGYGGKVVEDSSTSSNTVTLEHFTVPALSSGTFTSNTNPLALRILSSEEDNQELYIISNSAYTLSSTGNAASGTDLAEVTVVSNFNKVSRTFTPISSFTSKIAPKKGDLWSIGEIVNPNNYYSSKAGRLFKVTDVSKDNEKGETTVSALEYIAEIYTDSENFINYEPVGYIDITSPFATPPTPELSFTARPTVRIDGTFAIDGYVTVFTDLAGYDQDIQTDFYISEPETQSYIEDIISADPLTVKVADGTDIIPGSTFRFLGKNGFKTNIGEIKLLCTQATVPTAGTIELTVQGLADCTDLNFNQHILEVNDGQVFSNLKGIDRVQIPVLERDSTVGSRNFVGFQSRETNISRTINSYNLSTNKLLIDNTITGSTALYDKLPATPFYISISQTLAKNYYANNTFYVSGSSYTHIDTGTIPEFTETLYINSPVPLEGKSLTRVYIDGQERTNYTINKNTELALPANVEISVQNINSQYRLEVDYYTVPVIEVGDRLEVTHNTSLKVTSVSYDPTSAAYNETLTANNIFFVETDQVPDFDVSGFTFLNSEPDIEGVVLNTSGNYAVLSYDSDRYTSAFNLINKRIYSLQTGSLFEPITLNADGIIYDLPIGVTTLKAQNRNRLGRLSKESTKSVSTELIPIQKVQNLTLEESLFREQLGGVSVRVTCAFDHIVGQEVTDYEISYKITDINDFGEDEEEGLSSFNTVKVPSTGVDADGKIRYTFNNVNRGREANQSTFEVRVTPLNKAIRGITASASRQIEGKLTRPANIYGFTGGQQSDQITFFWQYEKVGDNLKDLDLKEVVIRRAPGVYPASEEGFLTGEPFVSVSAGSVRKSVPIDFYGTYTYFAKTLDTSGNFSESVVAITLTTSRPEKSTIVATYSEDSPNFPFLGIENTNAGEVNYPAYNESTGGVVYDGSTAADNANASAQGWSAADSGETDLLAVGYAEYITPIRDFGSIITGAIALDIEATQEQLTTWNDQKEIILEEQNDAGGSPEQIVDADSSIGLVIGYNNPSLQGRFDANNQTWMTGSSSGNVWAIWNPGQFINDTANANSYALIAGPVNATTVQLGKTFYANGEPTGSNTLANLTAVGTSFQLVNLLQFNDMGSKTFQGALGVTEAQTFIRTSTDTSVYYANGNVNLSTFGSTTADEGFVPYEAGTRVFRHFQFKHVVTNSNPEQYNYFLDIFRYAVDKEQTIYSDTVFYNNSPTVVDISSAKFLNRPTISYTVLSQADAETNPAIVVTTAATNDSISFKLFSSDGSGPYPADSTASVMITAIGV